jgi:tRNA (guanine-N7-)-methyltransferase
MQTPAAHLRQTNPYIDLVESLPEFLLDMPAGLAQRGQWQARFLRPQPLYVELGAGYGHFLAQLAPRHLDRNFVGIELKFKRLFKAASKIKAQGLSNVQYLRFDVLALEQAFAPGELSGVYINFPDPWPKSTHVSKRMVSPLLVAQLERLLPVGATVELKSDWEPNRAWFQEAFVGSRFEQTDYIANLSDWDRAHENVQTTYEARFRRSGLPCFFFEYTLR